MGEEPFGVQGRGAAGAGRGDRLAVGVVDEVAAGEDARDVGAGGAALDQHVALGVELDVTLDQLVARVVADGDEQAGDGQLAGLAGDGVAQRDAGELVLAVDGVDGAVPREADLGVGVGALGHDLGGAQLVAAVHDRDRAGELGQEGGLLDGGVTAADDGDVLVAEEEPVAGRAPGHPVPGQSLLVGQPELAVGRAHREDDRAGAVLGALGVGDDLDVVLEAHGLHVVGDDLGAEPLGLGAHVLHQVRAHDAVAEAGEVLDLGGVHQRPAGGDRTLEDQRLEVGARGVDRGRPAGRAGADDDDVADVRGHGTHPLVVVAGGNRNMRCLRGTDPRPAVFPRRQRPAGAGRAPSVGRAAAEPDHPAAQSIGTGPVISPGAPVVQERSTA